MLVAAKQTEKEESRDKREARGGEPKEATLLLDV